MQLQDFSITIPSGKSPIDTYHIILDARRWWSGLHGEKFEGGASGPGDEFTFTAGDGAHFSRQRLEEAVPGKKITWLVTESRLRFLTHPGEWEGSRLVFVINTQEGNTTVLFTHKGLNPACECYLACAPVWTQYMQEKLAKLLAE